MKIESSEKATPPPSSSNPCIRCLKLKNFFTVDHTNRWPVQSWSWTTTTTTTLTPPSSSSIAGAGDESLKPCEVEEECRSAFSAFYSRWPPLQVWCNKGRQSSATASSKRPQVLDFDCRQSMKQSRWPQGW